MTRFTLDWSSTNIDGRNATTSSGQTTDFDVKIPVNAEGQEWFADVFDGDPGLRGNFVQQLIKVTIVFDEPVEDLVFELFDVDTNLTGDLSGWDDKITVIALDADGNQVPVAFTDLAGHHTVTGNVVDANAVVSEDVKGSGAVDTVAVTIAGPIVSLTIACDNDGGPEDPGMIGISNIAFATVVPGGYVEGGSRDNFMNTVHLDDPDGDQINNNDAVLPVEGAQDDIIRGQGGADEFFDGTESDIFIGGNGGDVVVGGEDDDGGDIDILDFSGANVDFVTYDLGDPDAGQVTFLDGTTMGFSEIERVIPCFTPRTGIATPRGEVPVEQLCIGDRVVTRDNGLQEITWIGTKRLDHKKLEAVPELRPITIKAGSMGDNLPERDLVVSPSHRMLMVSNVAQLHFDQSEVLIAAKHMLKMDGVGVSNTPYITYIHIMCANHEIILADGAWSESFQPGDYTLKGFDMAQREELFLLFPELSTKEGIAGYQTARRSLKRRETKLLFKE